VRIGLALKLDESIALRLFGSEKKPFERRGLVRIEDGVVSSDAEIRSDHVAVDRITHAAAASKKFDNVALDGPMVRFRISADFTDEREDMEAIGLLHALIQDLTLEPSDIALGSQTTRGYGSTHPGSIASIYGSFHGALSPIARDYAEETQSRPGRIAFNSTGDRSKRLFGILCAEFDEHWQRARLRATKA